MTKNATYDKDKVVELYKQGYSFQQIGKQVGISKGMVSGFVGRMLRSGQLKKVVKTIATSLPPSNKVGKDPKAKHSRRYTFKFRPFGYVEPTKSELRDMLAKALENSK